MSRTEEYKSYLEKQEIDIQEVFRMRLTAKHISTDTIVRFPMIHIVVEKTAENYGAICLEYAQVNEASTIEESVNGLVSIMYNYFFTILKTKSKGREFLFNQLESDEYEHLWAKVRKFSAQKNSEDLEFIEKSFNDENLTELSNKLKNKVDNHQTVPIAEHREIVQKLKNLLTAKTTALKNAHNEIRRLRGFESGEEWIEENVEIMQSQEVVFA
ncbi:hypothetical protein [Leptospira jelokensis]|uniref:hypothetical protein n=1 Tax=Leptospira jelokensis TaxID=2484931 RepID=UPI0010912868|nr:hypothetical protein [Leptospira jelokensis]TGL97944.1 hypothetical protein EHQ79_19040 [Leptospira jelokensis]